MPTALLLVDIQQGLFTPPSSRTGRCGSAASRRCWSVPATRPRPIFHVRHDGGKGSALAEEQEAGFIIPQWPRVATSPSSTRGIRVRSTARICTSSFVRKTSTTSVISGVAKPRFVNSACRTAVALDYRVTLVEDGHTTYDTPVLSAAQIIMHHNRTLDGSLVDLNTAESAFA